MWKGREVCCVKLAFRSSRPLCWKWEKKSRKSAVISFFLIEFLFRLECLGFVAIWHMACGLTCLFSYSLKFETQFFPNKILFCCGSKSENRSLCFLQADFLQGKEGSWKGLGFTKERKKDFFCLLSVCCICIGTFQKIFLSERGHFRLSKKREMMTNKSAQPKLWPEGSHAFFFGNLRIHIFFVPCIFMVSNWQIVSAEIVLKRKSTISNFLLRICKIYHRQLTREQLSGLHLPRFRTIFREILFHTWPAKKSLDSLSCNIRRGMTKKSFRAICLEHLAQTNFSSSATDKFRYKIRELRLPKSLLNWQSFAFGISFI